MTPGGFPIPPNPDPISDQTCHFPHPCSDPAFKIRTRFQDYPLGNKAMIA